MIALLFLAGIVGIGFEIFHPGIVLPGALGAVALLTALFGFSVLPISWAGLALILLGGRAARDRRARRHPRRAHDRRADQPRGRALMLFHNAPAPYHTSVCADARDHGRRSARSGPSRSGKAVQVRRRPHASAVERSSARRASSAATAWSSSTASSGARAARTARRSRPGDHVRRSKAVGRGLVARRCDQCHRRMDRRGLVALIGRRPLPPDRPLPDLGDQGGARVRARRHLPPRPAAARAEGAGPLRADPGRRPDGEGRPAHDHAERAAAGSDHEGQRAGARERGRVLPDRRAEGRDRPGRELHGRDLADRADDAAVGARPARARRAALGARQDQRDPAGRSSTRRPRRGASRSRSSRSRTSRSRPACSARWRGRPRPSASGARR